MSADKYPSIFSCQMEAIVYIYHTSPVIDMPFSNELSDNHFTYFSCDWVFPIFLEIRNNISVKRRKV